MPERINDFIGQIESTLGPGLIGDSSGKPVEDRIDHIIGNMNELKRSLELNGRIVEENEANSQFLRILDIILSTDSVVLEGTLDQRHEAIIKALTKPRGGFLLTDEIREAVDATSSALVGKPFSQLKIGQQTEILAALRNTSPVLDVNYQDLFPSYRNEPLKIDESEVRPDSIGAEE